VESSVYCLPADLLGEGADRVVGTVRDRAGVSGVTVAACYHASRDILPHNPVYRVASLAPGVFYAVDPAAYPGPLYPAASPSARSGAVAHHPARRGRGPLPPKSERAEVCVPVPVGVRILGRTGGDHAPAAASSSRFRNVDLLRERIKPGESPGQCSPRSST